MRYFEIPIVAFDEKGKNGFRPKHINEGIGAIGYKEDNKKCIVETEDNKLLDILLLDKESIEIVEKDLPSFPCLTISNVGDYI